MRVIKYMFLYIILSIPLSLHAADVYVRKGTSGTTNGSDWHNAYSSLPTTLTRGNTYYIADGNYSGYTFNTPVSGTKLITIKKATQADHGSETGWSNSYGDGVAEFSGQLNFTTSHWLFDGVVGGGGPGQWTKGYGFKVTKMSRSAAMRTGKVSNINIRHIEVVGNDGSDQGGGSIANDGFAVYGGTNITLSYYYIHDMGRCIFLLEHSRFCCRVRIHRRLHFNPRNTR